MNPARRTGTARWIAGVALGLCVLLKSDLSESQDRAVAVPEMKVLLQNDRVRVQFHDVAVGETTPMHSHPAYVAYVFNSYTAKAILEDGREVPLNRQAGDVFFNEPQTHRIVNTGTTPIHNLIVELKK
jgi:quercetin dioxygenase-like cupin family protein